MREKSSVTWAKFVSLSDGPRPSLLHPHSQSLNLVGSEKISKHTRAVRFLSDCFLFINHSVQKTALMIIMIKTSIL